MRRISFRPLDRATLRGFATIEHDNGITLLDCALHERDGKRWCSPPSRPMLDRDRKPVIGDDGKECMSRRLSSPRSDPLQWSDAAVKAVAEYLEKQSAHDEAGAMSGGKATWQRTNSGDRDE